MPKFTMFDKFGDAVSELFKASKFKSNRASMKGKTNSGFKLSTTAALDSSETNVNTTSAEFSNLTQADWIPFLDSIKLELSSDTPSEKVAGHNKLTLGFKTQVKKLKLAFCDKNGKAPSSKVSAEHVFDGRFGIAGNLSHGGKTAVDVSVTAQHMGLKLGGMGCYNFSKSEVSDYRCGVEYGWNDIVTGTVQANRKFSDFVGSVHFKAQKDVEAGIQFEYFHKQDADKNYEDAFSTKFSVGGKVDVDDVTSVAFKADTTQKLNCTWTRKLTSPNLKFGCNVQHDFSKSFSGGLKAQKYGFVLSFGQ